MSISGKPEVEDRSVGYYARRFPALDRTDSVRQRVCRAALSSHRNMGAGAEPRLGPSLVDRHLAIVDPLFVHPLLAEPLLSSQRRRRIRRQACCVRRRQVKLPVLGECRQPKPDREQRNEGWSEQWWHARPRQAPKLGCDAKGE